MRSCGESEASIARALGIDDDTLRKHFADELASGFSRRRREVIGLLYEQARKGNVAAIKKLEEMTRTAEAAAEFEKPAADRAPAKEPKLGKKEQAQKEAETAGAGTSWGSDLEPPPPGTRPN